jgi:DNA-binding transcriptional LysR family regulator
MMSLAGLRAIESLAAHGSITAAAGALGYTPSAVSQQISRLERDVHQRLIERNGRRVTLTAAGRTLAEAASRVTIELEAVAAELQAQSDTVTGLLSVAAFPTAARGIVPLAMRELLDAWDDLELRILEVDSHRAVDLVAKAGVDLAVAHDWDALPLELPDGLHSRHLGDDISDVLVHESHALADAGSIEFTALSGETWLYEPGSVAHDYLVHRASGRGADAMLAGHVVSEYATQIALVAAGIGIALVPRMGRGPLPPTVRALRLASPPLRGIFGVWREAAGNRPAIGAALDALSSACARSQQR